MDRGKIGRKATALIPVAAVIFYMLFAGFVPPPRKAGKQTGPRAARNKITDSCTWNGIPLYGKVKFVESFPDIKIKFVESFPDLKVKFVESFPDKCGEWQVVESFPDFTVKVVESFPDITVKTVNAFPGKP